MIECAHCIIQKVSVHAVGNKTNGEELHLSKSSLDISDTKVKELLFHFFLNPFTNPEYNNFTFSNDDFTMNPLFRYATQMFKSGSSFHSNSVNIAKHLYELSVHPQIKSGDLFVVSFTGIRAEGELTEAIGIFKSENRQSFLKVENAQGDFNIEYEDGINIDKLDKGCLIFNVDADSGYKVCILDKSNKSAEAQYWRDSFLQLKPCSDDYHYTKEFLNITKNFVTTQLTEEFEVTKADQIDLLNRSVDYFKTHESFDKREFEKEVLQDNGIIKSFRNYDETYRQDFDIDMSDSFDISSLAVKKQARVFKSVLKLDKNFHIYIHGNRELIEQGVDSDGRKYYKIYFENES